MSKNRKRLATLLIAFSFMFVVGVAYAATNGSLTFTGTATLGAPKVELQIVSVTDEPEDGLSNGKMVVSEDGQSATITAKLAAQNVALDFVFKVENTGEDVAKVLDVITDNSNEALEIGGDYASISVNDSTIDVGAFSNEYTISVMWADGVEHADAEGDVTFTIEIPYEA